MPPKGKAVKPVALDLWPDVQKKTKEMLKTKAGIETIIEISQMTLPPAMRGDDTPPGMSIDANTAIMESTTQVIEIIYGKALTTCIREGSKKKKLRNFLELAEATPQCNAIVGKFEKETPCWICNLPIGDWYMPADGSVSSAAAEAPAPSPKASSGEEGSVDSPTRTGPRQECEHKFSIVQSLFFTGLYDSTVLKSLKPEKKEQYKKLLRKEYAWAHQRCNQIKTDKSLVAFKRADGKLEWVPNYKRIETLLTEIVDEKKSPTTWLPTPVQIQRELDLKNPASEGFQERKRDIVRQVERILNVANGIDTRRLLAVAVASLRKRAEWLYPKCWAAHAEHASPIPEPESPPEESELIPDEPAWAPTSPRAEDFLKGGGSEEEYELAIQVLEFVVKTESANVFFDKVDIETREPLSREAPVGEEDLSKEEAKDLGAALYGEEYVSAMVAKAKADAEFLDALLEEKEDESKLFKLYKMVREHEGPELTPGELETWIRANILGSPSPPGSPARSSASAASMRDSDGSGEESSARDPRTASIERSTDVSADVSGESDMEVGAELAKASSQATILGAPGPAPESQQLSQEPVAKKPRRLSGPVGRGRKASKKKRIHRKMRVTFRKKRLF